MSSWLSVLFTLILLIKFLSTSGLKNCLEDNNNFYCKFASKAPYRNIANYEDSAIKFSGCREKKIWFLIRHGTRYPRREQILDFIEELPKIRNLIIENFHNNKTKLNEPEIAKLSKWKITFGPEYSKTLAEEGENEMIDLAERFQSRFPRILNQNYDNKTYKFKYTTTQRTKSSAKNFALGLFGLKKSQSVLYEEAEKDDLILRFYKKCKRWKQEIHKKPASTEEREKFMQSRTVKTMLHEFSERIGGKLDFKAILTIYLACCFETALGQDSPWCELFSLNDFEIMEYSEDLKSFWKDGYGHSLNCDQSCTTLKNMFEFFESDKNLSVVSYFTHSGALVKFLCLLGLAKDESPLTNESFLFHKNNRYWRTSLIDTFGSNIAFIFYDCEAGPSILFMHQERMVKLPNCPENLPCPLSKMKDIYPDSDEECKFHEMCSVEN